MVDASLSLGAVVGVLLSGGFVYYEVGRFATPQVEETRFNERRAIFAYTGGLFVGVPLAIFLLLFLTSTGNGAWPGAILFLGLLLAVGEGAEWGLLRSRYFGTGPAGPFYALAFRAGVAAILILAIMAQVLGAPTLSAPAIGLALGQSLALLAFGAMGALMSLPGRYRPDRRATPILSVALGGFGYLLIAFPTFSGPAVGAAALGVGVVGAGYLYLQQRPLLATIPPPSGPAARPGVGAPGSRYGRTEPPPRRP
ncbi:MAG: hypothetical protein ACYCPV_02775 [Thermoplasmata archaeon]